MKALLKQIPYEQEVKEIYGKELEKYDDIKVSFDSSQDLMAVEKNTKVERKDSMNSNSTKTSF